MNLFQKLVSCSIFHCIIVLHLLCWSAESMIYRILAVFVLGTIIYFKGLYHVVVMTWNIAWVFICLVSLFRIALRVVFVFALYEVIQTMLGFHSADYKIFKNTMKLLITRFTAFRCNTTLNASVDGYITLEARDFVSLCTLTWNVWYVLLLGVGLYLVFPSNLNKIKVSHFWTNLYLSALALVLVKVVESWLWFGLNNFVAFERGTCLFLQYLGSSKESFIDTLLIESQQKSMVSRRDHRRYPR